MSNILHFFSIKDIKYASIGSVVIKFGAAFFTFLNGILLARFLGADGFGYYILSYSTMLLLLIPVSMGIPNLITRYISKYAVHNNYAAIKGLLIKTNLFVFFSTTIIFVIAFVMYLLWWKQYSTVLVETLLYSFLLIPLLAFGALRSAALRGLKFVILAEMPDTLFRNFLFSICILFCVLIKHQMTPQLVMLMHVGVAFIAFIFGYFLLRIKLLKKLRPFQPIYFSKEWIKESIPFSINSGIQVVKSKSLIYIIAFFGSVEAVAVFEVAIRGASLVSFTMDALNNAISPFVSTAFEKGQSESLQRILKKTGRIIFVFALPIALVFIIGGESLINYIFGVEYSSAYVPLVILCVGQLISASSGSVGLVLNMTGNQKFFSSNNIKMLALMLIFSVPLIIFFDIIGAALTFSGILVLQNIILLSYIRKNLNINTTIF